MSLPFGSLIGIVGGGQLAKMLAQAAAKLGFRCHIFTPDDQSCALDVAARSTIASYDDDNAMKRFAEAVDVITFEFENIPIRHLQGRCGETPIVPNLRSLEITQDRLLEKGFIASLGLATAPFAKIDNLDDLTDALTVTGIPSILKTRKLGYDGKGQVRLENISHSSTAWKSVGECESILEGYVDFVSEFSVILCRGHDGKVTSFPPTANAHDNHVLKRSHVPAGLPSNIERASNLAAERIANELGYVGVLAVEFFLVSSESGDAFVINEVAPRVHNSGHWTIEGCNVSQFEQHIRAITGLPLIPPKARRSVTMINLLGDEIFYLEDYLANPQASLHVYGKGKPASGRKMGHVTLIDD